MRFLILLFISASCFAADIQFNWDASPTPSNQFTAYVFQKETAPSTWTDVVSVASNLTTYLLRGIAPGTHTFRLVARNGTADSGPTNSVTVSPQDPPQAPGNPSNLRYIIIQTTVTVP